MKFFLRLSTFLILTLVTQVGGFIYLISLFISNKLKLKNRFGVYFIFVVVYSISTYLFIPNLAPFFGREKIKHSSKIHPANCLTIILNRNYGCPELNNLLAETELKLKNTDIEIHYLDANFPFLNKFPLLPHWSHNDGKKIDLSLIYQTVKGEITNKQKSRSGYGVFESPKPNEYNQINVCLKEGYIQYDYPKYLTFGQINKKLEFSEYGTFKLIKAILENKNLDKLFIEPHLKSRLNLNDNRIKYHGCRAVRHDDHIHIQLK